MMKFITSIAAFSLTFILSAALVGLPEIDYEYQVYEIQNNVRTQQNISYLLYQDISNGNKRDRKIYLKGLKYGSADTDDEYTDVIGEYVNASVNLDDSHLPEDFQLAWQNHMKIWRTHANFLDQNSRFNKTRTADGSDLSEIYAYQDREITRTWKKVLSVADKYGASVPYQYR